jgi:two-component system, NtrC family, response regulator AtoC
MGGKTKETEPLGVRAPPVVGLRIFAMWSGGHVSVDAPRAGKLTLGRGEDAHLVVDHASVSRRHATILLDPPLRVVDHESANGTWVDGVRIPPETPTPVQPGAVIELGAASVVFSSTLLRKPGAPTNETVVVDPAMRRVHELIDVVAKSTLTVLLLGETGVGKEMLAARVHAASPRATKAFLKVNCAALVESLLESELFGHERGAFTGASHAKTGMIEAASGGTLFLDEVGELTSSTQAKLLRVLENGEVLKVGATTPVRIDVRFVCATNRSLRAMVDAGQFREDLYFRLDGMTIQVPPLRDRPAEIVPLARHFLGEAARAAGKAEPTLGDDAVETLRAHTWRGNVRELKNVIARSLLFCEGSTLSARHLLIDQDAKGSSATSDAPDSRRARVLDALQKNQWNQTRTAKALGVSRRTLHTWLADLQIPTSRSRK